MEALPAADGTAVRLELRASGLVDPRLGIDELGRGVDPRQADGRFRVQALVEDCGEDRCERRTETGRAGGSDRQLETAVVEDERRRHTALEVISGLRVAVGDIGLAEEVVQL